jgi:hypothetical protein
MRVCNQFRTTGQRHGSEYAAAHAVMGSAWVARSTRDADDCEVLTEGKAVIFGTTCETSSSAEVVIGDLVELTGTGFD